MLCVYIGHHFEDDPNHGKMTLCVFFTIFVVVITNILLKRLFQKSGALLSGAMSIVSPAKFICGEVSNLQDCKTKTKKYLIAYCAFNMIFMYLAFVALFIWSDKFKQFYNKCHQNEHGIGKIIFLPILTSSLILSLGLTLVHWKFSLEPLFVSQSKYPKMKDIKPRKSTFPDTFQFPESFARSGFFYAGKVEENERLSCYDCGLEIYTWHWKMIRNRVLNDINVMHAANHLRYKAQYTSFSLEAHLKQKTSRTARKEILYDLYAKSISVKPECNALKGFKINFDDIEYRRKSFAGDVNINYNRYFTLEDIIEAGFVLTSTTSITCYSCLLLIQWSGNNRNFLAKKQTSPWSFHAESKKLSGSEKCTHLRKNLEVTSNRKLTFPKQFYIPENIDSPEPCLLNSSDYAKAGYFCYAWNELESKATVKCYEECGITFDVFAKVRYKNLFIPSILIS